MDEPTTISNNNHEDSKASRKTKECCGCMSKVTDKIIAFLEDSFARLGLLIGKHPLKTILFAVLFALLCTAGILRHKEESRREKLWVDQDSEYVSEQSWVREQFPTKIRYINVMLIRDDVLTSEGLLQLLQIDQLIKDLFKNSTRYELQWKNISFNRPPFTLLEFWSFNATKIQQLEKDDILQKVNQGNQLIYSPVRNRYETVSTYLSDIQGNSTHSIVAARVTKMTYFIKKQDVLNKARGQWEDKAGEDWEIEFGKVIKATSFPGSTVYFSTLQSFLQAGLDAIGSDFGLLFAGYALIIGYIAFQLGKFSRLQHKVWLALSGVLCVGLSIGVSYGLCAAFGVFYGPVHSILPFLLLGIGVDDVFVIIQTWDNKAGVINDDEPIYKKVSRTMRHAGVAITVTSFTDVCAFLIGASTVLPALSSFCIYAGVGIFMLFIFASTFFVALLTIDAKRQRSNREACCGLKLPDDWQPLECSKQHNLQKLFGIFAKGSLSIPGKVVVFLLTGTLLGFGIYGLLQLNQDFDPNWFLPRDSDEIMYRNAYSKYFPSYGINSAIYIGKVDYFAEQDKLDSLYNTIRDDNGVLNHTVKSWYKQYISWMKNDPSRAAMLTNDRVTNKSLFYAKLHDFITQNLNVYAAYFNYEIVNNNSVEIKASRFLLSHQNIDGTNNKIDAMTSLRERVQKIGFSTGIRPFAYTDVYLNLETNRIIGEELIRNLGLASACVFLVTLLLIANLWTSLLVLTCVAFTLVDICGFMYFWDLSIDTIISTILVVALGFAVDYAAHVGHAFMAVRTGNRNDRARGALVEIGPAVLNGGISTFLAFCLLAGSESYAFQTFFKVFFLVVSLGLWHGLVYLPVILGLVGPKPYSNAHETNDIPSSVDNEMTVTESTVNEINDNRKDENIGMDNATYVEPKP